MRVSTVDRLAISGEVPVRLGNYVDVYKCDVIDSRIPFMEATATPEEVEPFRLRGGERSDYQGFVNTEVPPL